VQIYFCDQCGQRVSPSDLDGGAAKVISEGHALCPRCVKPSRSSGPSPTVQEARRRDSRATIPAATRGTRAGVSARPSLSKDLAKPAGMPLVWMAVLGGACGIIGLAIAFVLLRPTPKEAAEKPKENRSPVVRKAAAPAPVPTPTYPAGVSGTPAADPVAPVREPPRPTAPSAPTTKTEEKAADVYDPRAEVAISLLAQAQSFIRANPDEVFAYRDKLVQLTENYKGTAPAEQAAQLLTGIKLPETDPATNPAPTPDSAWAKAVQVLPAEISGYKALKGNWKAENGVLRSDRSMWAIAALPYLLPEEYDLRLTFARVENVDCLLVVLARRGKPFIFSIGSGNQHCSLETIREKRKDVLPTKSVRPGILVNGQRTQVIIQVRSECLRAYLNGKPLVGCQVDDEGISLSSELAMPQGNQVGLETWNSVYEFYSMEVLELKGNGQLLR
jgi:hypothetical protein